MRLCLCLLALVLMGAGGCQTTPAQTAARPPAPDKSVDACAANLHEIAGLLLQYYLVHRDLPPRLEDALALADPLQPVTLTCPVSGQPYRYDQAGLVAPGETRRVIVLDPEPAHEGGRLAIVTVPRQANTPLGLWVVKLTETAAQQFHAQEPAE